MSFSRPLPRRELGVRGAVAVPEVPSSTITELSAFCGYYSTGVTTIDRLCKTQDNWYRDFW